MIIKIVNNDAPTPARTWWISGVKHLSIEGVYAEIGERVQGPNRGDYHGDYPLRLFNEQINQFVDSYIDREDIGRYCDWARVGLVYRLTMDDGTGDTIFMQATEAYLMTDEGQTIERLRCRAQPSLVDMVTGTLDRPTQGRRTVEELESMSPEDRATLIADGVITDPENDPRTADLVESARARTRAVDKAKRLQPADQII